MRLDWRERPAGLVKGIELAYQRIKGDSESIWGLRNGMDDYYSTGLSDHLSVEKIMLNGLKRGKNKFVFMDIGAGNFQWGRAIAESVNNNPVFNEKVQITIYSLRGESGYDIEVIKNGCCILHELGNIKVEYLFNEMQKLGHNLVGKVDFITSSWCFRHLMDPVGTLLQAHELLNIGGILAIELVFFRLKSKEDEDVLMEGYRSHKVFVDEENLIQLFASIGDPYFIKIDDGAARHQFVLKKSKAEVIVPLKYDELSKPPCIDVDGARDLVVFEVGDGWKRYPFEEIDQKKIVSPFCFEMNFWVSSNAGAFFESMIDNREIALVKKERVLKLFKEISEVSGELRVINEILYSLAYIETAVCVATMETMLKEREAVATVILNQFREVNHRGERALYYFLGALKRMKLFKMQSGWLESLIYLLVRIASPEVLNAQYGSNARTFIMNVVDRGLNSVLLALLLRPELNLSIQSGKGQTVFDIAYKKGDIEAIKLMSEKLGVTVENVDEVLACDV